ncbi:6-phosphofructokinase [Desulfuromonas sp. AOP6]|uniref:6-phosphofructokinase n=1 Tax=Desulfuromonas sp. AOP6 TaxID=1566351 RepID=UPI00128A6C41|nr:6-phosphofructokinase [Desulfuromonas sp. AOP6]BCA79431.1 ATP-dependent 6-phosphofructokinase [Desulfuromonas sp. AOP6]
MKKLAVLTSGGDCQGMNAAIRAVVRAALAEKLDIVGFQKGYYGLINDLAEPLTTRSVSGILQRGGTFLQSARCPEMHTAEGLDAAVATLKRHQVEGLVVIGGDGSLRGAQALHKRGIPVIGIPASIDNDIPFTDMSLGVDTALNNIIHAVDCLKDTASSHDRAFLVETMGRKCGYLAVVAAIACGAEHALIPEMPYDIEAICANLKRRFEEGRDNSIIMVAEGVGQAQTIGEQIKDKVGFETRIMVLGHYQRGGSPSTFDRVLAARFGAGTVDALMRGDSGKMVGLSCGKVAFTDLEKVLNSGLRPIDQVLLQLAQLLGI